LARFAAFFGERVFLAVFFFAAISLAPRTSAHVRCAKLFPSGGSDRGSRRKHLVGDTALATRQSNPFNHAALARRAAFAASPPHQPRALKQVLGKRVKMSLPRARSLRAWNSTIEHVQ
jgi:predicted component of type VI protein secretion system